MTYPERVIDVHTHIFNANHLPIQGLILTYTGYAGTGGSGDRTRLWLARTAARLIADLIGDGSDEWMRAGFVPFAADEGAIGEEVLISEMHQRIVDRSSAALWSLQGGEGLTAEARLQRIDAESLLKNLVEIELGYQESMATSGGAIVHPPSIDEIEATFEVLKRSVELASTSGQLVGASFFSRWALRWLLKLIGSLIERWGPEEIRPFVEFFYRMTSGERANAERIRGSYEHHQNVAVIVHHMMDLEIGFQQREDDPRWSLEEQLGRMKAVKDELGDSVIGFAAIDPRRPGWRDHACRALEEGLVGFKFYPPMGYRPICNGAVEVDDACRDFFEFCVEDGRDIPVFTHCTPTGFEACKGAGLNSDPKYWQKLLALGGFRKLRLCLGHAGGGFQTVDDFTSYGWYAADAAQWTPEANYAATVVHLCKTYPNVYCDFAYMHHLLDDGDVRCHFRRNFVEKWREEGDFAFADKAMFGSDAHMPELNRKTGRYLDYFREIFEEDLTAADFEKFCWTNAARYLKLH